MRWWQRSLVGQFIAFLLLALLLAQGLTMLITWGDQRRVVLQFFNREFLSRAATVVESLRTTPPQFRTEVVVAGGTNYTRFWITPSVAADAVSWGEQAIQQINRPLRSLIVGPDDAVNQVGAVPGESISAFEPAGRIDPLEAGLGELGLDQTLFPASARWYRFSDLNGLGVSVPLDDGSWLNAGYYKVFPSDFWKPQVVLSIGITAVILSLLAIATARRIARPLKQLALSADALGRGEITPLKEQGPDDIRRTSIAFNRMQSRLLRFVDDRTRMLAAISHDFRTPLTSLRLRAEFIGDENLKQKMLQTIAEMQAMTEATLTFAKEDATAEQTRPVELCSLVESLCDDLIELGNDIEFIGSEKFVYRCRPDSLRRAIRNLVENAVRYGGQARVSLVSAPGNIEIQIADSGPGIPEDMHEHVFSPFARLEQSRSRQTGGVGLGMSIARTIARHHGGDVVLRPNHPGLVAVVVLPEQSGFGRLQEAGSGRPAARRHRPQMVESASLPAPTS